MHPLLDVKPWPRALLQYPLLMLTVLLLGAALAFAYSYAPLHRAKDWEISYLQERLASRTQQVEELEEKLRSAESTLEGQPSSDEVSALRAQLDEASGLGDSLQKQVRELERKLERVTRSRDSWKQKHATVVAERAAEEKAAAKALAASAQERSPQPASAMETDGTTGEPDGDAAAEEPAPGESMPAATP